MRTVWASTLAGVLALAGGARAADSAGEVTVTAQGSAAVVGGDAKLAEKQARRDAYRNALEQAFGAEVKSITKTADFQLVSDKIFSTASGAVKRSKDLDIKNENGVVTVKIEATLSKDKAAFGESFGMLLLEAGNPKIAFVVAERMAGQTDFSLGNQERGKTENLLIEYFQARGASIVELSGLAGMNLSGAASSGELSAADAEKLAEKADAQYVIIGKVTGTDAGPVMNTGIRSYNMSLTLKMFSTATHEIVATTTKSNVVPCISPNLAPVACLKDYRVKVVDAGAEDLLQKTGAWFGKNTMSGTKRVQMRVSVGNFGQLNKFMQSLTSDVRGVSMVQQRSFKAGKAVLDVELESGDTNYLAAELSSKKIGGMTFDVTEVTADTVHVELKK